MTDEGIFEKMLKLTKLINEIDWVQGHKLEGSNIDIFDEARILAKHIRWDIEDFVKNQISHP